MFVQTICGDLLNLACVEKITVREQKEDVYEVVARLRFPDIGNGPFSHREEPWFVLDVYETEEEARSYVYSMAKDMKALLYKGGVD